MISPAKKRPSVAAIVEKLKVTERKTCRVLKQPRSTQRRKKTGKADEVQLTEEIIKLAKDYRRYD